MLRAVRAAVITAPACGSALLVHGVGQGCLSLVGAAMAVVLCWSTAVVLLGRQLRMLQVLLWTMAAQLLTHFALSMTCAGVLDGRESILAHLDHALTGPMLLAHGAMALICAAGLARADAGLWTAHRLLRAGARLRRVWLTPLPLISPNEPPRYYARRRDTDVAAPRTVAARLPVRRGPPPPLAA
jgi:hypothetical protein